MAPRQEGWPATALPTPVGAQQVVPIPREVLGPYLVEIESHHLQPAAEPGQGLPARGPIERAGTTMVGIKEVLDRRRQEHPLARHDPGTSRGGLMGK
jgi:hypothetical protein